MRILFAIVLTVLAVTLSGCGGNADKEKYKDQDRPRSTDDKPAK